MIHPLVPVIRSYLICLAVTLSCACQFPGAITLFAGFAWLPMGLIYPVLSAFSIICSGCSSAAHNQYQIVISGISNGTDCTDCSQYNGIWTVTSSTDYYTYIGGSSPTICFWNYMINPCFCVGASSATEAAEEKFAVNQIYLFIGQIVGRVVFSANSTSTDCHTLVGTTTWASKIIWEIAYGLGTLDCGGLSSYSFTFNSESSSGCNSDGSAALVTAL